MNQNEEKIEFCVRYLLNNGVDAERFTQISSTLSEVPRFTFTLTKDQDHSFFTKVAMGLRELWPPGNKEGKWPWRESISVLTDRLKFIWDKYGLEDEYTVDDCLEAGRKYLAQYQNANTKYMQILKYFIFKQKDVGVTENGMIKKTYESTLIKLLQDKQKEEQLPFEEFIV